MRLSKKKIKNISKGGVNFDVAGLPDCFGTLGQNPNFSAARNSWKDI